MKQRVRTKTSIAEVKEINSFKLQPNDFKIIDTRQVLEQIKEFSYLTRSVIFPEKQLLQTSNFLCVDRKLKHLRVQKFSAGISISE